MQVIRASHGKLWLLKAGNPRRTFPLRSVFSTFPTDRKFEFKLEIKANRRLSHVFHLLDNNLSLTYAMNHWMVQSVHTNALAPVVGSQSLGIWDTTAAPGLLDNWNCAHPVKIPFGWEPRGNCTNASNNFVWI
eukprot:Em0002g894a